MKRPTNLNQQILKKKEIKMASIFTKNNEKASNRHIYLILLTSLNFGNREANYILCEDS